MTALEVEGESIKNPFVLYTSHFDPYMTMI